jgi:outer membrane protein OmpA-like peptidoglycan-associated protein
MGFKESVRRSAVVGVAVLTLSGCATLREKPAACKVASFLTGAALGGLGGGLGTGKIEDHVSNGELAAGTGIGFAAGGLVGMIVGHYACKPTEVAQAAPPPPPIPKGTKIAEIPGPNFDFNKASLTPAGRTKVTDAARVLKDHPNLTVAIEGFTDSVGSDEYNMRLSERRATTMTNHLVEDGISRSRLHPKGYGESRPVADNSTAEGRARNRRVEIVVD